MPKMFQSLNFQSMKWGKKKEKKSDIFKYVWLQDQRRSLLYKCNKEQLGLLYERQFAKVLFY